MSTTTVRMNRHTWELLKELAAQAGAPMQEILDKAVEEYRRKYFLEETNKAYAVLRENPEMWAEEVEERRIWDVTNGDGERKENYDA